MNISIILQCPIQNSTENAILTRWNDALSSVNEIRNDIFSEQVFERNLFVILKSIILVFVSQSFSSYFT